MSESIYLPKIIFSIIHPSINQSANPAASASNLTLCLPPPTPAPPPKPSSFRRKSCYLKSHYGRGCRFGRPSVDSHFRRRSSPIRILDAPCVDFTSFPKKILYFCRLRYEIIIAGTDRERYEMESGTRNKNCLRSLKTGLRSRDNSREEVYVGVEWGGVVASLEGESAFRIEQNFKALITI